MMTSSLLGRNTPWLDFPLVFSGNYRQYECTLNVTEQCEYQQGYWRNWYEADHRYGLPTVAFFMVAILLFTFSHVAGRVLPRRIRQAGLAIRLRAVSRYLFYRTLRIPRLNWNSAPLGILLLGAAGTLFFTLMTLIPQPYYWPNTADVNYGSSPPIATRAGWMSLACMPFVFLTAGKANPLTLLTGVSHERLQVFHRWISYAFLLLALVHTFPFIVYNIQQGMMVEMWQTMVFYWTGVVALVAQLWLTFASWGPLRALCYEWFKFSHFTAALVFMLFLLFHCDGTLTAYDYFVATGVIFAVSWLYRQVRIYAEHGISHRAELNLASNGFVRVAVPTRASWTLGQHFFVRFMTLGLHAWTIHPFTACSIPSDVPGKNSELVFFIRPRGGFTARLARLVQSRPNTKIRVLLDGPYGGVETSKLLEAERALVIAGGSGAGWVLPFVTTFVNGHKASGLPATRRPSMKIILATRESAAASWFQEELSSLLSALREPTAMEIEIYYTGSEHDTGAVTLRSSSSIRSATSEKRARIGTSIEDVASASEKGGEDSDGRLSPKPDPNTARLNGRPDLALMIQQEAERTRAGGGNFGVFVCGPLSMQSDVSIAVAQEQREVMRAGSGEIYLHLEHFSWA